ncbi:NAD(P)/FAD-dependent oxidoreductase [Candidatus Micrarchaeota archaeon]|nr:NAD(P)/FAD-dependent oxidoreductase [Candidatus Micrarchaeota archaeon]
MAKEGFDYDVIIIGAGPAGTTMARILAGEGRDVLVVDKRKDIGSPVRCGEGLGEREVVAQDLDLPKEVISTDILGAKVVAPNGKSIVWKDKNTTGWVLERKMFDKWLAELAVHKGAEVHAYTRVVDLIKKDGKINGVTVEHSGKDAHEITAPLVVSAEGMEAHIARKAGFNTVHNLYDVDTCYQYEMQEYDHENLIELYFGNEIAPRGYVWIFPKKDKKANVGLGIGGNLTNWEKKGGVKGADPKVLLDNFIANQPQLKNASKLLHFGGIISVGAPLDRFVEDNFMVIGTAAKQVDPIHGGGIALAMESGLMAAKIANAAVLENNFSKQRLYEYEKIWRAGPGKKMEKRLMLRKVLEHLSDDDLNYIFNTITQNDLDKVMDGQFAGPVAKVVAGRPQLLGALKALA